MRESNFLSRSRASSDILGALCRVTRTILILSLLPWKIKITSYTFVWKCSDCEQNTVHHFLQCDWLVKELQVNTNVQSFQLTNFYNNHGKSFLPKQNAKEKNVMVLMMQCTTCVSTEKVWWFTLITHWQAIHTRLITNLPISFFTLNFIEVTHFSSY